jgi:hypothetical protein
MCWALGNEFEPTANILILVGLKYIHHHFILIIFSKLENNHWRQRKPAWSKTSPPDHLKSQLILKHRFHARKKYIGLCLCSTSIPSVHS